MVLAIRSTSSVPSASRTNITVNAPAGTAAGDVLVTGVLVGGIALRPSSAPAGWTLAGRTSYSASDPWFVDLAVYVRVHDGTGTSWSFPHQTNSSSAYTYCITGAEATEPLDAPASTASQNYLNTGSGTGSAIAPAITTVSDTSHLLAFRGSWDGNPVTAPAGWIENLDSGLWAGNRAFAPAGSTGPIAVLSGNNDAHGAWGIIAVALRPEGGGGTPPVASAGAVVWSESEWVTATPVRWVSGDGWVAD